MSQHRISEIKQLELINHLEVRDAGSTIREESNTANDFLHSNVDNQETSSEDLEQDNCKFNSDTISQRNLHSTNSQVPEKNKRLLK